jgi:ubiquinone biosynthesis protein UbiJ
MRSDYFKREEEIRILKFTVERLTERVEKLERQLSQKADKK